MRPKKRPINEKERQPVLRASKLVIIAQQMRRIGKHSRGSNRLIAKLNIKSLFKDIDFPIRRGIAAGDFSDGKKNLKKLCVSRLYIRMKPIFMTK